MNVQVNFTTHSDDRELSLDDEAHTHTHISKKLLAHEKELFGTKWFDYRFMTPFEATMKYVDDFVAVGRMIYRREFDLERSQHIHIMSSMMLRRKLSTGLDVKTKAALTGYWRGRQVADALCMPYFEYINLALTYRMRMWQRTYLPKPSQLYGEEIVEKIQARWEEQMQSSFYYSDHHAYLGQNYVGLPAQNDYHEFLFKQAEGTTNKWYHIARFVNEGILPIQKVEARMLGDDFMRLSEYLQ